jgi:predicted ABC-type ATPase
MQTGLINAQFPETAFKSSFSVSKEGVFALKAKQWCEHLAQLMATFLRERLLQENRKLSFETVFSHHSKIEFMREVVKKGYKVYLYFVATESPEINISRIKEVRVKQGGHDVPEDKIRARYIRSLDLLYEAAELAYQTYFFDNSAESDNKKAEYFAHFKKVRGRKVWDPIDPKEVPNWFVEYYLGKI